ncbi:hypothetical protein [Actinokineospora diospyrosa]|uniref:hypothetical protein n=1 Tax=Actinokineospora diospyrosa TaxID=103728 RepID=UPI0020A56F05|nr:hypothetical protein [Actinokineospora diospyrosa]
MTETPATGRSVSLVVAGLAGAVLLLVGGIVGYAIGHDAGPDRPGHSRHDRPPMPRDAQPRGQRPHSPPSQTPTSVPLPTPTTQTPTS